MGDKTGVGVIVSSFFRRAKHFPGFDNLVEFGLAVFAVGIFVGMVLEDEAFIFFLELLFN